MDLFTNSRFADAVRIVGAGIVRRRMPDRHHRPVGCPEAGVWRSDSESRLPASVPQSGGAHAVQLQQSYSR